ncbi:MAG: hypothetical protein J5I98_30995 [Phaeodactylibacter sp.]|nr:hypothetical protein [Phaeodactylibacter sp.]
MKYILTSTFAFMLGFTTLINAQAPHAFNYQAVVRNADGTPIEDSDISVQIIILREDSAVYQEEHFGVETHKGLFAISVGEGNTDDNFSTVDWQNGAYYLKAKVDKTGGTDFLDIGEKARLLSVPYALYAHRSGDHYWSKTESSLYYLDTDVGIGTIDPGYKLSVNGSASVGTPGEGNVLLNFNSERNWQFRQLGTGAGTNLELVSIDGDNTKSFIINTKGKVGIGTSNPSSPFHLHTTSDDNGLRITTQGNQEEIRLHLAGNANDPPENHYGFLSLGGGTKLRGNGRPSVFSGTVEVDVLKINGGGDGAEYFNVKKSDNLEPGSLAVIDDESAGKLKVSSRPYDPKVAGVISGAGGVRPGITLEQKEVLEGDELVSLWGRVYVKATAKNGKIRPGDLLTSSHIPGHVMKARKKRKSRGAVIGKALSSLEDGEGLVLLLIQPQ